MMILHSLRRNIQQSQMWKKERKALMQQTISNDKNGQKGSALDSQEKALESSLQLTRS